MLVFSGGKRTQNSGRNTVSEKRERSVPKGIIRVSHINRGYMNDGRKKEEALFIPCEGETEEIHKWEYCSGEFHRFDHAVHTLFPDLSLSRIRKFIKEGILLHEGEVVRPNRKLRKGEHITYSAAAQKEMDVQDLPEAEPVDFGLIYEDNFFAVINKPPGVVMHPAPGNYTGTLAGGLLYYFNHLGGGSEKIRPGIVHRLDKDTSGLLIVAKTDEAFQRFQQMFQERSISKTYQAVCVGVFKQKEDVIIVPVGRSETDRKKMSVKYQQGRDAETSYKVIAETDRVSFVEFYPRTGRTHQIRVHARHIAHSVLGDEVYGLKRQVYASQVKRHLLHARKLEFTHPFSGEKMEFIAPHFPDFHDFLKKVFHIDPDVSLPPYKSVLEKEGDE